MEFLVIVACEHNYIARLDLKQLQSTKLNSSLSIWKLHYTLTC